jgi:hypothetical protein
MTCSGVLGDGGTHDADGTGTGDEHVFTEDRKGKRSVNGVAERIEDGGHVLVDRSRMDPDVGHRKCNVFGKRPRPIDADSLGSRAEMTSPGEAVSATTAHDVSLTADGLAREKIGDIGTYFDDLPDEFVPDHQGNGDGLGRPGVPLMNVHVGPANPGAMDANEDVVDARLRLGDIF